MNRARIIAEAGNILDETGMQTLDEQALISAIAHQVKASLEGESSGHDWWHIHRVWHTACRIAHNYDAGVLVIQLAALLHDIADWKFHSGDETVGPRTARSILEKYDVPEEIVHAVSTIISEISFKGAGVSSEPSTIEGKIVQDADRLDAIGAMRIARAFAYGGYAGRTMHDPNIVPATHTSKEEYVSNQSTTVNHFYEKLLLLKARMNTPEAAEIAQSRHEFMQKYLDRFYEEWGGLA
jgi:uncharacterized protein